MKCDDDTFVRLDIVLHQISTYNKTSPLYLGNLNLLHRPLRRGKWAVTYEVPQRPTAIAIDLQLQHAYAIRLLTQSVPAGMARSGVSPVRQWTWVRYLGRHCERRSIPAYKPLPTGEAARSSNRGACIRCLPSAPPSAESQPPPSPDGRLLRCLQLFKMEDVSMGMWVGQFNFNRSGPGSAVAYVHSAGFCQSGCVAGYLTAHYQSPAQMVCLWEKLRRGVAQCCNAR